MVLPILPYPKHLEINQGDGRLIFICRSWNAAPTHSPTLHPLQPTNQTSNHPPTHSPNQPTNQPTTQPTSQPTTHLTSGADTLPDPFPPTAPVLNPARCCSEYWECITNPRCSQVQRGTLVEIECLGYAYLQKVVDLVLPHSLMHSLHCSWWHQIVLVRCCDSICRNKKH